MTKGEIHKVEFSNFNVTLCWGQVKTIFGQKLRPLECLLLKNVLIYELSFNQSINQSNNQSTRATTAPQTTAASHPHSVLF